MTKLGVEYERAVADLVRACGPGVEVQQGKWITGPDGRRDRDVWVTFDLNGRPFRLLIECKDFHPRKTGPVGILWVDALDSKRRDLGATHAFMCCNAGFTTDAVRKARRVGIGLMGLLKKGDPRVRHKVVDELYFRKLRIVGSSIHFDPTEAPSLPPDLPVMGLLFEGLPVANWVHHRIHQVVSFNPIVSGVFEQTNKFTEPLLFTWQGGSAKLNCINIMFSVEGSWFSHETTIDTEAGIYSWARQRLALGPGKQQVTWAGVDFDKGKPMLDMPDASMFRTEILAGELGLEMLIIDGTHLSKDSKTPDLDRFLIPEDRDLLIPSMHKPGSFFAKTAA